MVDVSDLHIYRARVYKRGTSGDDRLQVRILPLQADITDSKELNNLPKFPPLIKGQVFNCRQECSSNLKYKNGQDIDGKENADYVCVVANSDWTFGYVLGLENQFYGYMGNNYLDSWGFTYMRDYINNRGLGDEDLQYEYLVVQAMSSTPDGGFCEFYNWKNGNKYIINRAGSCIMILQDKVYIRAGSPGVNGAKNPFSAIEMTGSKIVVKTPCFDVTADNVILGHHNQYLLSTACSKMPVSAEGINLQPITAIMV
jgi:hypothetical protein